MCLYNNEIAEYEYVDKEAMSMIDDWTSQKSSHARFATTTIEKMTRSKKARQQQQTTK
jgi:hypothetical protein